MNYKTVKKILERVAELLGNLLVDVAKFTFCTLVLSSMFENLGKTDDTYLTFIAAAVACLVAGAILTHNKNNK